MYTTQAKMYGFINQSHSDNTCNLTCATWEGELYNGFVWNDQITTLDIDNPICKFLSTTSAIQEDTCHAPPIECADDPCHTGICLFDPVHVFKCDCSLTYFQGLYCQIDPCKIKHCLNNGICTQGVCQCAPGFEGNICEFTSTSIHYYWKLDQYTKCDKNCNKGIQNRSVQCFEKTPGSPAQISSTESCQIDKPSAEKICNDIYCGQKVVRLSIRLDIPYISITASAKIEETFRKGFIQDIAHVLEININRIQIDAIKEGSVIIDFSIFPGIGISVEEAETLFKSEIESPNSWLNTQSEVVSTSKTVAIIVKSSVIVAKLFVQPGASSQEEDGLNIVIPISIGSAVLVIVIVSVLVYFFVCKRKKDLRITRRVLHPYTKLEF